MGAKCAAGAEPLFPGEPMAQLPVKALWKLSGVACRGDGENESHLPHSCFPGERH